MDNYGAYLPSQVLLLTFVGLLEVCVSDSSSIRYYTNVCGRTIDISGPDQAGMIVVDYDRAMSFGGLRRWTCKVNIITRDVGEQIAFRFIARKSTYQCQNTLGCFCNSHMFVHLGTDSFVYCMPEDTKNSSVKQSYDGRIEFRFDTLSIVSGSFSVLFSPFTRAFNDSCGPSKIKCNSSENICISESIRCSNNDYEICDDVCNTEPNQPSEEGGVPYGIIAGSVVVVIVWCFLLFIVCCKFVCRQGSSGVSKLFSIFTCNNRSTAARPSSGTDQETNQDVVSIILERRAQTEEEESRVISRTVSHEEESVHHSPSLDRPPEYSSVVNSYQEAPPPSYLHVILNQEAYKVIEHS